MRGGIRFPSMLLQPLGHRSLSLESIVYWRVAEPDSTCSRQTLRNLNEAADWAARRAAPNGRVNLKCAHQVRPPPQVTDLSVDSQDDGLVAQGDRRLAVHRRIQATRRRAAVGCAQPQRGRASERRFGRVMA